MTSSERFLLEWLGKDNGQYGECKGKDLDALIAKGLACVVPDSGFSNGFIAKGGSLDYQTVTLTEAGREALSGEPTP